MRSGQARRAMPRSRTVRATATPLRSTIPAPATTHHLIMDNPVRTSALRTLGAYANVFAIESFMDELAAAAGIDPVAFRLAHIKDERERAVIEAWARPPAGNRARRVMGGAARGIGYARYKTVATYVAVIAEVEVNSTAGIVRCRASGPRPMPGRSSIPTG